MVKTAIFASGSGTNAQELILHFKNNSMIEIALILSNKSDAYVLKRAERYGVPSFFADELFLSDEQNQLAVLREFEIDFIILAGYLKLIPPALIDAFPQRIVNLHPALLPKFGGKGMYGNRVHKAVLASEEKESGISVHYVNKHYDRGQIIAQFTCPVFLDDTYELLAERIHKLEHEHYPAVCEQVIRQEFEL